MVFNDESLNELRLMVKDELSERRFIHTLGVERAAVRLAQVFIPDKISEIRACALLHDITKELPDSEQLKFIEQSGLELSDEDFETRNAWHSFSAVGYIKKYFPEYATQDILNGVSCHTLGCKNMSLFSAIIFISDYVEDGRAYQSCKLVSNYLWNNLNAYARYSDKLKILYKACIMSIDYTVKSLEERGIPVNKRIFLTKTSFESLI